MIETIASLAKYVVYFFLLVKIVQIVLFFYKNFLRKRINLKERYGANSWVLVTGATDGIGKSFCEEFAREGFNIILVSRTVEKLKAVAFEIESKFKVKTQIISYDFTQKVTTKDYEDTFGKLTGSDGLDISILVNNVGLMEGEYMPNVSLEFYKNMIDVNVTAQTMLTKILTPSMSKRSSRSAVVDLSSVSAIAPLPYRSCYAATKRYNEYLNRALNIEYLNNNIDFLCVKPYFVASVLSRKKYDGFETIMPNQCVNGVLNDLGQETETNGHWIHKIYASIFESLPAALISFGYRRK